MPDKSSYDEEQDSTQRELFQDFQDWVTAQGGPNLIPTEWKELIVPVPFTDRAVYPPWVAGGHLLVWKNGGWFCGCHEYPDPPFNPFWGVEDHPLEAVGIHKYKATAHDEWILTYGEITKSERLDRIAEVLEAMNHE